MAKYQTKPRVVQIFRIPELIYQSAHEWQKLPPEVIEYYEKGPGIVFKPFRIDFVKEGGGYLVGLSTEFLVIDEVGKFSIITGEELSRNYEYLPE